MSTTLSVDSRPHLAVDLFEEVAQRDPIGHRVHVVVAMLYCVSVAISQAPEAISIAMLAGCAVLRLPKTWRLYPILLKQPVAIAFSAWSAWQLASVAWSPDPKQGFDEVLDYRVLFVVSTMWPVMSRLPWFVACVLAGAAAQPFGQVVQLLEGRNQGGGILRVHGMLHAIQTGALLAAAMVWHLGPAMLSSGWWRRVSWAGLVLSAAGLFLTGSRGPWLSALVSIPMAIVYLGVRFRAARPALGVFIVSIAVLAAGWMVLPQRWKAPIDQQIRTRLNTAITEYRQAIEDQKYDSDVGLRVKNANWSLQFFMERPYMGAGAGSFRSKVLATADYPEIVKRFPNTQADFFSQGQPHSTYLHVASATGLIGLILFGATVVFALIRCIRDRLDTAYAPVHLFVLIGWLVGAAFDSYNLNAHEFGLFALVITFTCAYRARVKAPVPEIQPVTTRP